MHDRVGQLVADPRSVDQVKFDGSHWWLRSGRWRAILDLDTRTGTITVVRVLARNEGTYR